MSRRAPAAWWPCFVCASQDCCTHREPELVSWMREGAAAREREARRFYLDELQPASLAVVRKPPTLAASATGGEQYELFRRAL